MWLHFRVREMTTAKIGSLLRISGQVVRTHPVHPELVLGTFMCLDCRTVIPDVEQQFKFTQVNFVVKIWVWINVKRMFEWTSANELVQMFDFSPAFVGTLYATTEPASCWMSINPGLWISRKSESRRHRLNFLEDASQEGGYLQPSF